MKGNKMKIEMGESLGASWLKHVKKCQIVQTNWKSSPCWELRHDEHELSGFMDKVGQFFAVQGLDIFKNNANFNQIMRQAECDVIGCIFDQTQTSYYSLEVAYHGSQLNYGSKNVTIAKVIAKLLKSALVFYCYLDVKEAEVAFASPKIGSAILNELERQITNLQTLFNESGFCFRFSLYANHNFWNEIMKPVLELSNSVADTGELFLRSYQLYDLIREDSQQINEPQQEDATDLPKVAHIVREELVPILQSADFPQDEIEDFMDWQFSRDVFGLGFPLLAESREPCERYYAQPITLHGQEYYLCSQWYERNRGPLIAWIEQHRR